MKHGADRSNNRDTCILAEEPAALAAAVPPEAEVVAVPLLPPVLAEPIAPRRTFSSRNTVYQCTIHSRSSYGRQTFFGFRTTTDAVATSSRLAADNCWSRCRSSRRSALINQFRKSCFPAKAILAAWRIGTKMSTKEHKVMGRGEVSIFASASLRPHTRTSTAASHFAENGYDGTRRQW